MAAAIPAAAPAQEGATQERDAALKRALAIEDRIVRAIDKVAPAVVTLTVKRVQIETDVTPAAGETPVPQPKDQVSGGSGVIVSEDGYILTNDHVVSGAAAIVAGLPDGRRFAARRVASDETGDIALLKVEGRGLPHAQLADSSRVRVGQWVLALGNPFGLARDQKPSAALGIVSGLNRYQGGGKIYGAAIQTDAAINPGNSGGPLVDLDGRVVGINGRISIRGGERVNVGVGFAISSNQIGGVLADLKTGRDVHHGYLGIRWDPLESTCRHASLSIL